jgi:hypothetical protein
MHLDFGMPFIRRLQILSGGQELEDIDEYGRLYSILLATQGNPEQENELSINQGRLDVNLNATSTNDNNPLVQQLPLLAADTGYGNPILDRINGLQDSIGMGLLSHDAYNDMMNPYLHNGRSDQYSSDPGVKAARKTTALDNKPGSMEPIQGNALFSSAHPVTGDRATALVSGENSVPGRNKYTYNIPLVSAILNNSKYWPLIFTNLGLDIYIHLEDAVNVGAFQQHVGITKITPKYEISNVRYHAHLVDVDRSFYDRMRMAMQASGGVLQMSGTTYKHYMDTKGQDSNRHTVQISTRLKSLNALLVRPQRQEINNKPMHFCISTGEGCFMDKYAFRVGSIQYPQRGVECTDTNLGESYCELKKTFGVLGDYTHNNFINRTTFNRGLSSSLPGNPYAFFTAAYGFEGFAKTATESGINVSDRALPVVCEIERTPFNEYDRSHRLYNGINVAAPTNDGNSNLAEPAANVNMSDVVSMGTDRPANIRYDIFAVTDMIIYITADGSVSTRI